MLKSILKRSKSVPYDLNDSIPIPIKFISELYYNPQLEKLIRTVEDKSKINLSYWHLIDNDIITVCKKLLHNGQCIQLNLCGNKITSKGISILSIYLKNNRALISLNISYNPIKDFGIQALCRSLTSNAYSSLEKLYLNKASISDDSMPLIAKMLETNQTLIELHLSHNEIGNQSVKQLANVLIHHNKTLKVLVISFNIFITNLCVNDILDIIEYNQTLEKISIHDCNLSDSGKRILEAKLSNKKTLKIQV